MINDTLNDIKNRVRKSVDAEETPFEVGEALIDIINTTQSEMHWRAEPPEEKSFVIELGFGFCIGFVIGLIII